MVSPVQWPMVRMPVVMLLAVLLSSCSGRSGTPMKISEIEAKLHTLALGWGLTPVRCPEPFQQKSGRCYAASQTAEAFSKQVDAVGPQVFRSITGWRDDYGVRNTVIEYKGQPYEVGIGFVRPNTFWDGPEYTELVRLKARGYVDISVADEKPRDR